MTKNFKFIDKDTVESTIIARGGYRAFVPRTWFNEEVKVELDTGESYNTYVKTWNTGVCFINITHIFDDNKAKISLVHPKPLFDNSKTCLCGCGQKFIPKALSIPQQEEQKYIKEHYQKYVLNKKDGYKFSRWPRIN